MNLPQLSFYGVLLLLFLSSKVALGQEETGFSKNSVSIGIGHAMVAKGVKDGSKQWLALPSWALDYNFRWSEKWAIGLHNDIILTDFDVESIEDEQVITRSKPFSSILIVGYSPIESLMFYAGGGGEFAREENFVMIRVGAEPSFEISESFELLASFNYDFKVEGYDSFGLCLGVGYKF